jgi:hypothetical protein
VSPGDGAEFAAALERQHAAAAVKALGFGGLRGMMIVGAPTLPV